MLAEVFAYLRNYIERRNYCPICLNGIRALGSALEVDSAEEDGENHKEIYSDHRKFFSEWKELRQLADEPAVYCSICMAYFSPEGNTILEREDHELIPYIEVDGNKYYRLPGGGPGMAIQDLPEWSILDYFNEKPGTLDPLDSTWTHL